MATPEFIAAANRHYILETRTGGVFDGFCAIYHRHGKHKVVDWQRTRQEAWDILAESTEGQQIAALLAGKRS